MKSLYGLFIVLLSMSFACADAAEILGNDPLRIGALLSMTGSWASGGIEAKASLELALEQVNAYLAPSGHSVELVFRDTQSSPAAALSALKDLKAQDIPIVIGPLTSDEATTMMDYANANEILLISPSSTAPSLSKPDNLLRLCPDDTNQAQAMVMLMQEEGIKTVLTVYPDEPYGEDFHEVFDRRFAEAGGIPLEGIRFSPSAPDYASLVAEMEAALTKLELSDPEKMKTTGVFFIGSDTNAIDVIKAIPKISILDRVPWYASEGVTGYDSLLREPQRARFAARTGLKGFTLSSEDECLHLYAHLIMQMVAEKIKANPTPFVVPPWEALWLIAETYRTVPHADFETFKNAIVAQAERFYGAMGFCELNENGDKVAARYALYAVKYLGANNYAWRLAGTFVDEPFDEPELSLAPSVDVSAVAKSKRAISIGTLIALTDLLPQDAQEIKAALKLAIDHVNGYLAGKGSGLRFKADVRDTKGDPGLALKVFRIFYLQEPGIVIAHTSSNELAALEEYAQERGIPVITPCSSADFLAKQDRIMRLVPNDSHRAKALSALMEKQGVKGAVALYHDDLASKGFLKGFEGAFTGAVTSVSLGDDTVDIEGVISNLHEAVAKAKGDIATDETVGVVAIGCEGVLPDLLKQIAADSMLSKQKWFGSEYIAVNKALLDVPEARAAAAQVQFTCPDYSLEGFGMFLPQIETLNYLLGRDLSGPVSALAVNLYDAVWLVARAYEHAGDNPDLDELWEALQTQASTTYGLSGPTFLDMNGDRMFSAYAFYTLTKTQNNFDWKQKALYRNAAFASDVILLD